MSLERLFFDIFLAFFGKKRRNRRFFTCSVPPRERQAHPVDLKTKVGLTSPLLGSPPLLTQDRWNNWGSHWRGFGRIWVPVDSEKNGVFSLIDGLTTEGNIRINQQYCISELIISNRIISSIPHPLFIVIVHIEGTQELVGSGRFCFFTEVFLFTVTILSHFCQKYCPFGTVRKYLFFLLMGRQRVELYEPTQRPVQDAGQFFFQLVDKM